MDRIMAREARKRQHDGEALLLLPEDRMRENAWLGAIIYPVALIIYGWTTHFGVIWVVPVSLESVKPKYSPKHAILHNVLQMQERK